MATGTIGKTSWQKYKFKQHFFLKTSLTRVSSPNPSIVCNGGTEPNICKLGQIWTK